MSSESCPVLSESGPVSSESDPVLSESVAGHLRVV